MGTRYLQASLSKMLGKHIQEKMPNIRKDLQMALASITQELKDYGYKPESQGVNKTREMRDLLHKYSNSLRAELNGPGDYTESTTGDDDRCESAQVKFFI